jgi:hypothetical protein
MSCRNLVKQMSPSDSTDDIPVETDIRLLVAEFISNFYLSIALRR